MPSARFMFRVLLVAAAFATGQVHGALRDVAAGDIDAIFAPWDKPGSPGVALAVLHEGRIIYERGYGRANLEHEIPITPESVFYVGSVSKQFTAAAVSLLARQGRLNLDDDVRRHVPELPSFGEVITVRQLVHHTSGLRDYLGLRSIAGEAPDGVFGDADVLALITKQKALNFAPGSEYLYSNSGYFLLSLIVKRVSGKTLRQFAAEHIFEPLGMKSAQFRDDHSQPIRNRADGYAAEGNAYRLSNPQFDVVGAGGVFMSVRDFLGWDENFYQPKLGDRDWIAALETPGRLNNGASLTYAFGLVVRSFRGLRVVEHEGAYGGYRAHAFRVPAHHFSVICFTNLASMSPAQLSRRVTSLYLADLMTASASELAAGAGGSANDPALAAASRSASATLPPEGLDGSYHSEELEVTFRITRNGNALQLHRGNRPPQALTFLGEDVFRAGTLEFTFRRGADNNGTAFRLDSGRVRGLVFTRN
jgi:CubicO group peptidase (beta-lactamase class C family)